MGRILSKRRKCKTNLQDTAAAVDDDIDVEDL